MLTIAELDAQSVELLPAKETLWFDLNMANVYAMNSSLALNAGTILSSANSVAYQSITVVQG
ncbi:hypothetical protein [Mycetocola sp.]|uniref:hypothetical protein n=1 Tax=Mycetocola sp. TaxID=1871042 RepID=UPI0039895978